jgi:hypothetical protein
MVWCLIKHRENFTFNNYIITVVVSKIANSILKTGVEPAPKTLCMLNIPQAMNNVQHNFSVKTLSKNHYSNTMLRTCCTLFSWIFFRQSWQVRRFSTSHSRACSTWSCTRSIPAQRKISCGGCELQYLSGSDRIQLELHYTRIVLLWSRMHGALHPSFLFSFMSWWLDMGITFSLHNILKTYFSGRYLHEWEMMWGMQNIMRDFIICAAYLPLLWYHN